MDGRRKWFDVQILLMLQYLQRLCVNFMVKWIEPVDSTSEADAYNNLYQDIQVSAAALKPSLIKRP